MCLALIHNVPLRVKDFRRKTSTLRGPERPLLVTPRSVKRSRLAAFDKFEMFFFIYVCSDDCLKGKSVKYLLLSYNILRENWP